MQIMIEYPDYLPDALQKTQEEFQYEACMAMAVKLFEMGRISSGIAANLVGIDRVLFLLNLHRYDVAMINYDDDELKSDAENA